VADALSKLIAKHDSAPITVGVKFTTTGLLGMDWILGGGIARGRLIELSGAESSGKSTMGLQSAVLLAKETGKPGLWLDYEFAWEPRYVADLGGTLDGGAASGIAEIALAQPLTIEEGFKLAISALDGGMVSSAWFDSTGVMQSEASGIATTARAIAQGMPKLIRSAAHSGAVVGFISQTREIISEGFGSSFGPKRQATGGRAAKHAFSQRVEFTHLKYLKGRGATVTGDEGDSIIGRRVLAKVIKNKVAVPMRYSEFDLIDGHGFARSRHLVELAIELGIVRKSGSWLTLTFSEHRNVDPALDEFAGREVRVQGVGSMAALLDDPRGTKLMTLLERLVIMRIDAALAAERTSGVVEEETDADADGD
jgi:recombination protein RecA